MKKGFSLIEVLVVVIILPFVTIALSRVFATFIRDIPRMTRVVEQNTTVLDMVGQLRQDMDTAIALPDAFGGKRSDSDTLLIQHPQDAICYQFQPGRVDRTVLSPDTQTADENVRTWTFPDAVVEWTPWKQAEISYALEIHTLIRQRIGTKLKDKMVNSYVLFVGQPRKDGQL
jgi:prepilin-type N-terminal cleavage/methylation domain-containing protein